MRTAAPGSSWFLVRLFNKEEDMVSEYLTQHYLQAPFLGSCLLRLCTIGSFIEVRISRPKNQEFHTYRICVSRGMYFMMTYDVQIADC